MNYTQFYLSYMYFIVLLFIRLNFFFIILPSCKHIKIWLIKKINRIKVMLAEKGRTNKWLAVQVGKDPATISKWCTNAAQPSLEMLLQVAKVLEVEVKDLIREQDE